MTDNGPTSEILQGLAGAPGRAMGPAFHWRGAAVTTHIAADAPASERLRQAFAAADALLAARQTEADDTLAPLLEAQRLMLDDPELHDGAFARLAAGATPEAAVTAIANELAAVLEGADTAYFRERAIDVRAVGTLVARLLTGDDAIAIPSGAVALADALSPLDTAQLADAGVAALVTVRGGPTCHAAIIARAWGIPAVVGVSAAALDIADGTPLLVDGTGGQVIVHPTPAALAEEAPAAPRVHIPRRIPLYANVGSLAEVERALVVGAEGIGLLRTEFLFHARADAPGEDEQTAIYTAVLRRMAGRPVIIRTLDLGADKPAPFLPLDSEPNPQLGLRGIRLCLRERELFRTQLRALLRSAGAGTLKIMLPMVTTADEVAEVRTLLAVDAATLDVALPPLGAMIEVPMAALAAPELAAVCDFFSLGTNDLLQFLLAADRQHAGVGYLHATDHPAVWRLLEPVIAVAHAAGIPVGVCGEWGADPEKLARLVDLGIDSASVAVGALPRVRALFE